VATISSGEHVVQGGPGLVRINKMGQTNMEIVNCTNHTITKDAILGIIKKLMHEDKVGELKVNEMTVNLKPKEMKPSAKRENIFWTMLNLPKTKT
jgi:transcriptional regulator CtsR